MIYLDNNATTRLADEALAAMLPYFTEIYGNSHAAHSLGRRAEHALEHARDEVSALLGADAQNVIFTSCGTESNAMVLYGFHASTERRKVICLSVEHPSISATLRQLHASGHLELEMLDVEPDGTLDLAKAERAIDDRTALVCVMLAQNETGIIYPVAELARLAHVKGAMILVDAVQAAGKIPVDVRELGVDFLSISGHKFHAPKGIGALYIAPDKRLTPIWQGGGHERGLRSGTSSVPLAVAFGVAAELAQERLPSFSCVGELRDEFETRILRAFPDAVIHGRNTSRLPNTALVSFPSAMSGDVVRLLDQQGICASGGAACDSAKREPSAVMRAMRQPLEVGLGAVRFSLSRYTTMQEIEQAAAAVVDCVPRASAATVE